MSFASGPVSFQRFFINGRIPSDIDDAFVNALNERAFGRIVEMSDNSQIGWIGPGHLFETKIDGERIAFGRFAHFAVRLDRTRVPANVMKAYIRMEEEAALEASGREYLGKTERRQAREAAVIRAEKEARAGSFRRMSAVPALLDLERGVFYLANQGAALADKVMPLFADTFGASLEPADTKRTAERMLIASGNERALEKLPPAHLVRAPDGYEDTSDWQARDLDFLGREFLTWIWYRLDATDGPLRIASGDDLSVAIDRTLKLQCDFDLTGTDVITADHPTTLPESKAALRIGKQPTRAGLVLGSPLGEFRFTLDASRLTVSTLVLPEDESERDVRARIEQRFELLADTADLIDAVYEVFLQARTSRNWNAELRQMSAWASGTPVTPPLTAAS